MQALLDLVERHLGSQWLDIADWLRTQNGLDEIEARIAAGDWKGAVQSIDDAAKRWAAETHSQYVKAAETGAKWLDDQPATADSLIRFDVTNPAVIRRAQQNQLENVVGFRDEANAIAQQIAQRALVEGTLSSANPREIAKQFRDSIGLAPVHEEWLASYRKSLETGDYAAALQRELSSGHSDRTIAAALDKGRTLTQDQIDTAVDRYRENLLTYRAETIARTESGKNVHQGVEDAFRQAIDRGDVDADQLEKEWIHSGSDEDPRENHKALDGTRVPFDGTFDVGGGVRMKYPHDESAPVKEVANCTCTYATTLKAA